jgi:hypothetical protein
VLAEAEVLDPSMAITRSITRGVEHFAMDGVTEGETVMLGLKLRDEVRDGVLEWEVVTERVTDREGVVEGLWIKLQAKLTIEVLTVPTLAMLEAICVTCEGDQGRVILCTQKLM